MAITSSSRFENRMDYSSPETIGDAKEYSDSIDDGNPYADNFEEMLEQANDDVPISISDIEENTEEPSEKRTKQENNSLERITPAQIPLSTDFENDSEDADNPNNSDGPDEPDGPDGPNGPVDNRDNIENDISTAIDGKVRDLPTQELPDFLANSFKNGNYRTVEATEDITLYRVYGQGAGKQGCFLTTQIPTDRLDTKIGSALPTKIDGEYEDGKFVEQARWNNSREFYCEVEIPKGTVMNIGKVGEQTTTDSHILPGGNDQVLVSPEFASNPNHYKEEHLLGYASNYLDFEKKAKELEQYHD